MTDLFPLDNPIWHALSTGHRDLAQFTGLAARYPSDVSPLAGLHAPTPAAFADLAQLIGPAEGVGLFTTEPVTAPADWQVVRARPIEQMVCTGLRSTSSALPLTLQPSDVPEMLALAAATEPGPFQSGTIRMGRYYGIRSTDGRLIAMAGERLRLDGFIEISAVCTDPSHRGHGYGRTLVEFLASQILDEGKVPFLHVKSENGAKALYEQIGFSTRRAIQLTVLARR